jgi:hypothetical protein
VPSIVVTSVCGIWQASVSSSAAGQLDGVNDP